MRAKTAMAWFLFFSVPLVCGAAAEGGPKVSRPLAYSGYTFAEYQGFTKFSQYVPMRDGVRLAVDVFLPSDGPERASFPVILQYTPYQRAMIDLKPNPLKKALMKGLLGVSGPIIDISGNENVKLWLSHGYACVAADIRGSGASFGWKADLMPLIGLDGRDLVNWIADQPWCDGNVGMYGLSYLAYSQFVTAANHPKALKCILPWGSPFEPFTEGTYPGGIYSQDFTDFYSSTTYAFNMNYYRLPLARILLTGQLRGISLPAAPVKDEDGDGDLLDEIPVDSNHNGSFLDELYPPQYPDHKFRYNNFYYNATMEHYRGNIILQSASARTFFLDVNLMEMFPGRTLPGFTADTLTVYDLGPAGETKRIMESGIPVYNWGGWFDALVRGTTEWYATLADTNPSKLLILPAYHAGPGPFAKYLGLDPKQYQKGLMDEALRYFDHYLKGVANGIETEPPVTIYVMNGEGWRSENEWPLAREQHTDFYFAAGNRLAAQAGPDGGDPYQCDFTHDARFGKNQGNRWVGLGGRTPSGLPIRTGLERQCLSYTGEPLDHDLEVTGHPLVNLWVSSSADDGDFFVYLEDVDEKGVALLVSEGQLRSGFAHLYDNNEMIHSGDLGIEVLPKLPWHGYEKAEYIAGILAGNRAVELTLDLMPTSWVFRKGHQVRVSIACADWPTFQLHPGLAPDNMPRDRANVIPIITVYRDVQRRSRIQLPVIPR
ncbi:MAG TPA: CocE/NonD family hydrolase [bacterium]|nr:CocE/NonD family hydrolase [bacterium]